MTTVDRAEQEAGPDINLDLGFGTVVSRESRQRLLNRDGSFNVLRDGLSVWQELSPYHYFLTITWPKFLTFVGIAYIVSNTLFALAYMACGDNALTGFQHGFLGRFWIAFFFSVETIATIGYGNIVPVTLAANILMTFESLFGILAFALIAGIVFGRFARPNRALSRYQRIHVPHREREKDANCRLARTRSPRSSQEGCTGQRSRIHSAEARAGKCHVFSAVVDNCSSD
ncbi:MAG: hypothetical protein DMF58_10780 [Acidobacteria bacterium]|nr:MAG: hypothetical protein DMF58_10780 [Acidobacteriota bacterium]